MSKKKAVFLFTRDLRLYDNLALNEAIQWANTPVLCLFIFRSQQIGESNPYRSDNAISFMIESLEDLSLRIRERGGRLRFLYEDATSRPNQVLCRALRSLRSGSGAGGDEEYRVYSSKSFSPFGEKRDSRLQKDLKEIGWEYPIVENHTLSKETRNIRSGSGKIYTVFKPFYDKVLAEDIPKPMKLPKNTQFSNKRLEGQINLSQIKIILPCQRVSPFRLVKGGETEGLHRLRLAKRTQQDYASQRDRFTHSTSLLSAYHHFGCISIRHSFHSLRGIPSLVRQLVWRDYAYHQMAGWNDSGWKTPTLIGESIPWKRDTKLEYAWKNGQTGIPIVDAAMRQLRQEGYIHNRGRMAVANFLVKNLNIHWRVGEQHFAKWLTDYDWSVNFMNWIQIASILPTDQPYRGMNPFIQAKKFDPDLEYIRKYIPELRDASPGDIFSQERTTPIGEYPAPIVGYTESKNQYLQWAKQHIVPFKPSKEDESS
jgi:deoxyribodipyrimidine photo-lyase